MPLTLTVRDETLTGQLCSTRSLELPRERMTIRELIRERVYQEVQDFNAGGGPAAAPAPLDWRPEFDKAVAAFTSNAFLILVDERQATSLDEEVELDPNTRIRFVRLTLLVGG